MHNLKIRQITGVKSRAKNTLTRKLRYAYNQSCFVADL